MKNIPYHEALGLLMQLQVDAYPDLLITINLLLYFTSNPNCTYQKAMKYILAYVKNILEYSITYHKKASPQSVDFIDLNFANNKHTQKLTKKYIFYVKRGLIFQTTKRQ